MPIEQLGLDLNDLAKRYLSGASMEQLGKEVGVDPTTLARRLRRVGVAIRDRRAAQATRYAQSTAEQRIALTAAANVASRGIKRTPEQVARSTGARAEALRATRSVVGGFEQELQAMLVKRGVNPTPQLAAGPYNIDLALPPVAVEVHVCASSPLSNARLRKRVEKLAERGWSVLYVWISKHSPLTEKAADKVVSLVELAKRNPSTLGQHWVIRGSGEDAVVNRRDSHHRPGVGATVELHRP